MIMITIENQTINQWASGGKSSIQTGGKGRWATSMRGWLQLLTGGSDQLEKYWEESLKNEKTTTMKKLEKNNMGKIIGCQSLLPAVWM